MVTSAVSAPIPAFPSELGLASLDLFFIFLKEKGGLFVFLLQQQEFSCWNSHFQSKSILSEWASEVWGGFPRFFSNFSWMRLGQGANGVWGHHLSSVQHKLLCEPHSCLVTDPGKSLQGFPPSTSVWSCDSSGCAEFITPKRAGRLFFCFQLRLSPGL